MVEPNLGDRALSVGETRQGAQIQTTLLDVRQGVAAPDYLDEPAGTILSIRQCASDDLAEPADVLPEDFLGEDADGGQYTASNVSWDDWPPPPQWPRGQLTAGRCITGNVLIDAPESVDLARIVLIDFVNSGDRIAEWNLP